MERNLMKGNEALAEAAIRAGCKCFFGYPITPQTEISAYMAKRMPKVGGVFLQAESEIAAINMVYGCASSGVRCMTSSSSPGICRCTRHDFLLAPGHFAQERGRFLHGGFRPAMRYRKRNARRPRTRRHSAIPERLLAGYQGAGSRRLPDTCIRAFHRSGDGRSHGQSLRRSR